MKEEKYKNPPHLQPIAAQTMLLGMAEHAHHSPGVEALQEKVAKENKEGAFVDMQWTCVVGRKI